MDIEMGRLIDAVRYIKLDFSIRTLMFLVALYFLISFLLLLTLSFLSFVLNMFHGILWRLYLVSACSVLIHSVYATVGYTYNHESARSLLYKISLHKQEGLQPVYVAGYVRYGQHYFTVIF